MAENRTATQAAALAEEILRFTGSQAVRVSPHMYGKGIPKPSPDAGRKLTDRASVRSPTASPREKSTDAPSPSPSKRPGSITQLALQNLQGTAPQSARKGDIWNPKTPSSMSARSRQDSAKRQMAQTAPSSSRAWSDRENAKSKHNELLLFLVTHFPDPEHLQRAQDQLQQLKRMRELRTMSSFWKLWSHRSRTRSFAEVFRFTKSFHQVRVFLRQWRMIVRIARDLEQERNEPAKETRAPSSAVPIVVPSVKERQKALQTRNPQPQYQTGQPQDQTGHAHSPTEKTIASSPPPPGDVRRRISPAIIARFGEPISPRSPSPFRRSGPRQSASPAPASASWPRVQAPGPSDTADRDTSPPASMPAARDSMPARTLAYANLTASPAANGAESVSPAHGHAGWVRAQAASLSASAGPRDLSPPPDHTDVAHTVRRPTPLHTLPVPETPPSSDAEPQLRPPPLPSRPHAAAGVSHPHAVTPPVTAPSSAPSVTSPGLRAAPSRRDPLTSPPGSGPHSGAGSTAWATPSGSASSQAAASRGRAALPHLTNAARAPSSHAAARAPQPAAPSPGTATPPHPAPQSLGAGSSSLAAHAHTAPGAAPAQHHAFAANSPAPTAQRYASPAPPGERFVGKPEQGGLGTAGWNQYLTLLDGKVNNLDALITNLAARLQKAAKAGQEAPGMYLLQLHNEDLLARNETLRQHLFQAQERERWLSGQLKRMSQLASEFHAQNAQVYPPQSPPRQRSPPAEAARKEAKLQSR